MGARIEPGEAAAEGQHAEFAVLEEGVVDRGDLQFATGRRLDLLGDTDHLVGIEIQSHHGVVALGLRRFFLDAFGPAVGVERHHAVALRIAHPAAEDRGFGTLLGVRHGLLEQVFESGTVEDIVAQDHADRVAADEFFSDDESLCQAVGRRLFGIAETDAIVGAVAQQPPESRQVVGRGDDEDLADPGHHQDRDRIIDHRLVIDGDQLLRDALGDGVEAGPTAACEYDAFHKNLFFACQTGLQILIEQDLLELRHADRGRFLNLAERVVIEADGFRVDEEDRRAGLDIAEQAGGRIDVE